MQNSKQTTYRHKQADIADINRMLKGLTPTLAEAQEALQIDAKNFIMQLFGWMNLDYLCWYTNFKVMYLIYHTGNNISVVERLMASPAFEAWFNNAFLNRCIVFVEDYQAAPFINPYIHFLHVNNARLLAQEIYPPATVWDEINRGGYK